MNNKYLNNFESEGNNIPYLNGIIRIGDFKLHKNDNEKVIEDAKIGFSIYGIKSLEKLQNTNKNIIIVIPALTGNSKIFDSKPSQGNGWANTYGKSGNILDPTENIIIGLDYFGGPHDSSGPDKHNLNFYPVPPEKQVEAWKKAIEKLGIKDIYALFGGSNGGGHIHTWLFDNKYIPKYLIPVAGPIAPTKEAKEFFSIQVDFIKKKENISLRLAKNLKNLIGQSRLYDELVKETTNEIYELLLLWNDKSAMKIVRQIGFLKFLNPSFFDKFEFDKNGNKLFSFEESKENMMKYFQKEGINFEKRFSLSSLILLSQAIVDAERISPEEYIHKIKLDINIIIISIEDDKLFETIPMQDYFKKVKKLRQERGDKGKTTIELIKSNNYTQKAGHDSFLWEGPMQEISDKILKNI